MIISVTAGILFLVFPRQIISIFGNGSEEYFRFGVRYFRIYMMMVLVTFIQPLSSNFFTAIGKPGQGVFLSLTRQIIFLLPLIVVLPMFFGIDGLIYAGPVADVLSVTCASVLASREWRLILKRQRLP
jgi:Na+-driven multidrug efflux pump